VQHCWLRYLPSNKFWLLPDATVLYMALFLYSTLWHENINVRSRCII